MSDERNKILGKMLERLYASLATGPVLNCRPHSSRQRIDLTELAKLDASTPETLLSALLEQRELKVVGKATLPEGHSDTEARERWDKQQSLTSKLRGITEDARTYEQDTGAQVLYVGYPLLSFPADQQTAKRFGSSKRILAPIAFIPVTLTVKTTAPVSATLACAGEGADLVIPNAALLAWVEKQTGKHFDDLFADEEGKAPWREMSELVARVASALDMPTEAVPKIAATEPVLATPRSDADDAKTPSILSSAVLGLFPITNQNLLRDLEALAEGEPISGPLESFLRVAMGLGGSGPVKKRDRRAERLVTSADPCQARAVRLARVSTGLVVHGPPGTGKSQTIANILGDHLARGERVLFVCDKRTALDVVQYRLSHLGLGQLCAIVHDAHRDQRELYKSIREQLDGLPESKTNPAAVAELELVDAELEKIHAELVAHHEAIARAEKPGDPTLHSLAGEWFGIQVPPELDVVPEVKGTTLTALVPLEREVREVLTRSQSDGFPENPWCDALGVDLATYLSRTVDRHHAAMDAVHAAARKADETLDARILPFSNVATEGPARAKLAEQLGPLVERLGSPVVAHWASQPKAARQTAQAAVKGVEGQIDVVRSAPLDPELAIVVRSQPMPIGDLLLWLGKLAAYLAIARKWYGFIFFGRKRDASDVLQRFGLALSAAFAERVAKLLDGVRARRVLQDCYDHSLTSSEGMRAPSTDDALTQAMADYRDLFDVLAALDEGASSAEIRKGLTHAAEHAELIEGLRLSAARASAIGVFDDALRCAGLFAAPWIAQLSAAARRGEPLLPTTSALEQRFENIEGLLRVKKALAAMPKPIAEAITRLCERGRVTVDVGWDVIRKAVLAGEIRKRIDAFPILTDIDADRVRAAHERVHALEDRKRVLVRDGILHAWTTRQRERLLASTGSRLNGAGAELKRRLTLRGERAMRVRQVIAAGANGEGGDPLFDVRPIWMASPETVAQIFPRKAVFDVVVFDEASQCRLEEALPVLTRAKRVVIAGDPKQLPPTRFFESAVTQSQDAEADTTDQGLFEDQQSEIEDLLGAALNLEIEQCYLDVHYRSQNSDLIEFSNKSFYDARLQPIPGHPRNRAELPPLRVVRVSGVYEKRVNVVEAEAVVGVVRELLARPKPPSIGIACFNLVQRDAIVDALDEAAASDSEFATRLAVARTRRGAASFDGLFVKNLENVQGDERDHMIISTTYGPDAKGRFYRRFGPLALAGGGRRLNVLVTRARQEVHLVTSIPREVYASLPPVEPGRTPNGAWLLFSYLQYAEELARLYKDENERLAHAKVAARGTVLVHPSSTPSKLAEAFARRLAAATGTSSDVHWGNDGFCVDVALHHPTRAADVSVGILCDGARYERADDQVEWDLFRTRILEGQGWKLVRLWTPQVFRDPAKALEQVRRAAVSETQPSSTTTRAEPPN